MPYYCTVPRCTSMAGKAKNVSFHQFPRDEELAKLWNEILKRGKPYTKYSKVCSLHFRPEDYTITSVGKNKGQWRTLRKDALPSQNLPSESPAPTHKRSSSWVPNNMPPSIMDPRMQQQMAQAIYMQTMLAMQANSNGSQLPQNLDAVNPPASQSSTLTINDIEQLILKQAYQQTENKKDIIQEMNQERHNFNQETTSYKCDECSKCFKDPDVFILHRRTHKQEIPDNVTGNEKENCNSNSVSKQETLKANPILANLLKSGISSEMPVSNGVFDTNNILSIENQIMTALAANMESYIRNLSTMLSNQAMESPSSGQNSDQDVQNFENGHNSDHNSADGQSSEEYQNSEGHNYEQEVQNYEQDVQNLNNQGSVGSTEPNCDNEDLNVSKDSNSLVIDENV